MNKITKTLFASLLSFSTFLSYGSSIFANTDEQPAEFNETYYESYDINGEVLSSNVPKPRAGTYTKSTVVASGTEKEKDCGIHPDTNIWRKVSSYGFSKSKTVSISVSAGAYGASLGVSKGTSTGISFTISANEKKYSKVRMYISYTWKRYKISVYDNYTDRLLNTYYSVITNKTHENFKAIYE